MLLCLGNLNKEEALAFIHLEFSKILMPYVNVKNTVNATNTVNAMSYEEALLMVRKMGINIVTVR